MVHLILAPEDLDPAQLAAARDRLRPAARAGWRAVVAAVIAGLAGFVGFVGFGLLAIGFVALAPGRAMAFCRTTTCAVKRPPASCMRDDNGCWATGIPLAWNEECVSFSVNVAGSARLGLDYDAALAIVQQAFDHWPLASCSDGSPTIAFSALSGLTCNLVEYNSSGPNANAVLFRDDVWTHDPSALALTTVAFNTRTGQILNADMEINTQGGEVSVDALPFIITHESGHFIGLDHAPDPGAVMFYQYNRIPGEPFTLTDDDIAGLCEAYPPSRSVPPVCDFQPPKGYATDCGGDVQAACAVAPLAARDRRAWGWGVPLLVGLLALVRWRSRKRQPRDAA
jgi:matrixin